MKRRVRRVVMRVGLLCVLAWSAWVVIGREVEKVGGERQYAAAEPAVGATDPDWRWEAIVAKRRLPPPGRNGMDVVQKAYDAFPLPRPDQLSPSKVLNGIGLTHAPNVRLPAGEAEHLRLALDTTRTAVELARSVAGYPDGHFPASPEEHSIEDPVVPVHALRARQVALYLCADAMLATEDADTPRTVTAAAALLNTARALGDEPLYASQVVRVAVRAWAGQAVECGLAHLAFSDGQLARLQAAWAADAEEPLFWYALRGERALYDQALARYISGEQTWKFIRPLSADPEALGERFWWWRYKARLPRDRAELLAYFTSWAEVARLPAEKVPVAAAGPPLPVEVRVGRAAVAVVESMVKGYRRSVAEARCVVAALACERFRLRTGRWPAGLAELPPDLLAAVPIDPFDGQPLRSRRLPDGLVVYSVGENRTDDGGTLTPPNTLGRRLADEGVRLWNPDARRRPAPPDEPPPELPDEEP